MRILVWHVHGGWMDAFVRGDHEYLIPASAEGGAWGLGRAGRDWPRSAVDVSAADLGDAGVDVVVLQRPEEIEVAESLLGRRLGRDIAAVYVEHNAPRVDVPNSLHPLADRDDITIAHVTHFNKLMWDCGTTRTTVIEHGVRDPGPLYTGVEAKLGVVINEPVRRWRVTGSDLLAEFARAAPIDVFGMGAELLPHYFGVAPGHITARGDLPPGELHPAMADCRVYLHPVRWTSLGLALLEAMHIGMPVVALATTEAYRAVPPEAGYLSTNVDELVSAARRLIDDPDEARSRGQAARRFALEHYGLAAFLDNWTTLLDDAVARARSAAARSTPSTERNPR